MSKKQYNGINIISMLGSAFRNNSKSVRVIIGISLSIVVILPFFSVSNLKEAIVAVLCTAILLLLSCIRGKIGNILCCIWSILLIINLLVTPFIGAPFGGLLSNERMRQKQEEKFHTGFAKAMYEMSIRDYENALASYAKIESIVPKEYRLEFYLWYGGIAMYAGENELSIYLLDKAKNYTTEQNAHERDILYRLIPIGKMVDYLNTGKFNELMTEARRNQNTNEQIFILFELVALVSRENIENYEDRIRELLIQYPDMQDSYDDLRYLKNDLMFIIAGCLFEEYPEYSLIFLAQMFEEDKANFYETFIYCYPKANLMNIRWLSIDYLRHLRGIYEDGWFAFQGEHKGELEKYMPEIENLGYYLGVNSFIKEKFENQGVQWEIEDEFQDWELYNVIPLGDDCYFGVWLETNEGDLDMIFATIAHFYTFYVENNQVHFVPIKIAGDELAEYVTMNKLFLVENTRYKDMFLVEHIEGTGEFLSLGILDINAETYEIIENPAKMYHTSEFKFDIDSNSYTAGFEIYNSIDANMTPKVGGKVTAEINFERNIIYSTIKYPDPAIEFYVEERNNALILPLESLNKLNGREIKNEVLLEKIHENSIPYYQNSMIQHYYSYFLGTADAKFSGITIVYDSETEEEASFFYYVERVGDEIQLLEIYQIVDNQLQSVYE